MLRWLLTLEGSILTFVILLMTPSRAAILPETESLLDAIYHGRNPECLSDQDFGVPPLDECNAAVSNFQSIITGRGFQFDEARTIEFLDIDTMSLHADLYPRQPLTEHGDYHTFTGKVNARRTCIIRFFMLEPPIDNPDEPASSLSTYNDFLAGARKLIEACVMNGQGGHMPIRVQGRDVSVSIEAAVQGDPDNREFLALTKSYQPNEIDKLLIPKTEDMAIGVQQPSHGAVDQGSSAGSGTGTQGPIFCSLQQNPTTCQPGSSCQVPPYHPEIQDDGLNEEQRRVFWGNVVAAFMEKAGTCAGEMF